MKEAILLLNNKADLYAMKNLQYLQDTSDRDVYLIFHKQDEMLPHQISKVQNLFLFTSNVMTEMGYVPIGHNLAHGNCHFPILKFYLSNPNYDFYWVIEDDVCFTGRWKYLFDSFKDSSSDLITSIIRQYSEDPEWPWWKTLHNNGEFENKKYYLRSFNPIYRISAYALNLLDDALKSGWRGHNEVVLPTLLAWKGCSLQDMGGIGRYTNQHCENKFYDENTMSHLPLKIQEFFPQRIYHPIKEKIGKTKLKENCIIAAVGKNSLHKSWLQGDCLEFDLHLIVYDDSYGRFYDDTDFASARKGFKMKLVYDYLMHHPEYLNHYNYFFIPDDDIYTTSSSINVLFSLMKKYNLKIAQPALSLSYCTYYHTLKQPFTKLRYSNFVEMMLPCFSRSALKIVLPTFNANDSGWGIEYRWAQLIDSNKQDMGIIDEISMIHTRPIQSNQPRNQIELEEYINQYHLNKQLFIHGYILNENCTTEQVNKYNHLMLDLISTASNIIESLKTKNSISLGLNGLSGISLLLLHTFIETGNVQYRDLALLLLNKIQNDIREIGEDTSFFSGKSGINWYIKNTRNLFNKTNINQHLYIQNIHDEETIFKLIRLYNTNNTDYTLLSKGWKILIEMNKLQKFGGLRQR